MLRLRQGETGISIVTKVLATSAFPNCLLVTDSQVRILLDSDGPGAAGLILPAIISSQTQASYISTYVNQAYETTDIGNIRIYVQSKIAGIWYQVQTPDVIPVDGN